MSTKTPAKTPRAQQQQPNNGGEEGNQSRDAMRAANRFCRWASENLNIVEGALLRQAAHYQERQDLGLMNQTVGILTQFRDHVVATGGNVQTIAPPILTQQQQRSAAARTG